MGLLGSTVKVGSTNFFSGRKTSKELLLAENPNRDRAKNPSKNGVSKIACKRSRRATHAGDHGRDLSVS